MSAIFGLIRLDGPEVREAELDAMRAPMAYWGPDGGGLWRDQWAGLGQLVAHHTPEDVYEAGPHAVAAGTIIVAAAGRLDNREELCLQLKVPEAERATYADGRLIASAYERWGDGTPTRLLGDWAFAAWHPRERRLILARDHFGQTALYWHRSGTSLAFSSSLKGLLALPAVPRRLNELRLAESLVICAARGEPTMYQDINRLPTARALAFDGRGLHVREYWSLLDVPEVQLASDDAYAERLLDLLTTAVRVRLRACGSVASTLSAGLDSAAVTAVAARELGAQPLSVYTARPAYSEVSAEMPDLLVDEWPGAAAVAGLYPNVRHTAVRGQDVTPLAAIRRSLLIHDEPEHAAANLPWITALLDQVRSDGAGTLLTGQFGNGSMSWPGDERFVLNRIGSGDVAGTLQGLLHARAMGRGGWRGAAWRGVILPLRGLWSAERMRRDPARQPGFATSIIAPEFAERIGLIAHVRSSGWDPAGARTSPRERRLFYLRPGRLPVNAWWHQRSAAHQIDVRDPTAYVPLVEFTVGTPHDQFARDGHHRWLMRRALRDLVPPEVAWSTRRGAQGADIVQRLRADQDAVTTAVEQLAASEMVRGYLDVSLIARAWTSVRGGASESAHVLSRGLMFGLFLLRLSEAGECG